MSLRGIEDLHGRKTPGQNSTYSGSSDSIHPDKHSVWGWILVAVCTVFAWYITPHALDWWERLVNGDRKIEVEFIWEYPIDETEPDRFVMYRNSKLYQVYPGDIRKAKGMVYEFKDTILILCSHNLEPDVEACGDPLIIKPTDLPK